MLPTTPSSRPPHTHPLSHGQKAIWFVQQLVPGSTAYNVVVAAHVRSEVDFPALRQSFLALAERHPVLRTTYAVHEGVPVQVVHDRMGFHIRQWDAKDRSPAELEQLAKQLARRPFDLEHGPVWKLDLYTRAQQEHVLVLTLHHIAVDLAAMNVLFEELGTLYAAAREGNPVELPALPLTFGDYVRWQEELLAGPEGERLWNHWKQELSGELPVLNLPLDYPRPAVQSYQGASYAFTLAPELVRRVRSMAKTEGSTFLTVLTAAFQVLLHRYTGQPEVIVGTPVPGRRGREGLEGLMGSFINMLPLRSRLSGDPSFRELLAGTKASVERGRAHQEFPFSLLVERLLPTRDASRSPLFQAMIMLQRTPREELTSFFLRTDGPVRVELGGLVLEPIQSGQQEGLTDLSLEMMELEGRLHCELKYDTALFARDTITRMANAFTLLLNAAVEDPSRTVAELPLLSEHERHRLLVEWNDRRHELPLDKCLPELFREQASRTPDAIAVRAGATRLTYRELAGRTAHLAAHLAGRGVRPESPVAIALDRGTDFLTAILAVHTAGGACVLIDPTHPAQRVARILEQSGAVGLLVSPARKALLEQALEATPSASRPALWDVEALLATPAPARAELAPVAPGNLAFIVFTSGSTGVPKGAMMEHRGMLNHLFAKVLDLGITAKDVMAQTAPPSFVICIWQTLAPLLVGAQVDILEDEVAKDPRHLLDRVAADGISVLQLVPSVLRLVLDDAETRGPARLGLPSLRWLVPTGEALPPDLCRRWLALYPAIPLLNAYGCSECSDDVAHHVITSPPREDLAHLPIGRPVANLRLYVLDARMQPVPVGVPGELFVGGVGVGRGYLNDAQRTSSAFVSDPFSQDGTARLYRTGDLARRLPGGEIEFLGRADHQVKVRGIRIELGEIESVLRGYPALRDTVVLAVPDASGSVRLVGYLVPRPGQTAPEEEVRQYLRERLPEYMVPSALVTLEALPLNANGKVDRRALPVPGHTETRPTEVAAPRGDTEAALVTLWSELLGVEHVSIHDNFFALGGHSLLAVKLIIRLRERFGVELPLHTLFELSTIARQAAFLDKEKAQARGTATPVRRARLTPEPAHRLEPFSLTELQQAYWLGQTGLFERSSATAIGYIESEVLDLDVARFNAAFRRVIERHDTLRSVVRADGLQQVLPSVPPFSLEVTDLRGLPEAEVTRRIEETRQSVSRASPRPDTWPLFTLRGHRLDERRYRLHLAFPLLMGDLQSFRVINRDLERAYHTPEAELGALEVTFRDYVRYLEAVRESDEGFRKALAYWRDRLPTLPPAPLLPLVNSPSALRERGFQRWNAELGAESWQRLKARGTRAGLTPTAVLAAAYAEVLAAWSQSPHFTLNLLYQNRPPLHPQVGEVVGNFSTTVLLEVDNRQPDTFEQRARRVQTRLWSDLEHTQVSGTQVIRELALAQGTGAAAAMPIVFASTLYEDPKASEETQLLGQPVHASLETPHVWIDHQASEQKGALRFHWDVLVALFPEGMVDAMFRAYLELLGRLADSEAWETARPVRPPASELTAREAANATEDTIPHVLLQELFASRAEAHPEHPAVIEPRGTYSYGTLQRRAHQLAHRLRALGAKPNTLVAIVMEKGWEQVAATLGVLGSGAAYMPIDPEWPVERIHHLLRHGEARIVLTQPQVDARLSWPEEVHRLVVSEALLDGESDTRLAPIQRPEDLAYVIFTSGSTGEPKGVMIDHRGAANTIVDLNARFGVGPADRVLALSSLTFDLSVYDIFGVLAAGGTLVLPDPRASKDPAHWLKLLRLEKVTLWNSVPALMQLLVEYAEGQRDGLAGLPLRTVMLSGDWIPVALPDRIKALGNGIHVVSMGGATEASIWSILHSIDRVEPGWQSIPYGKPLKNQRFHVLDERLAPRPTWVTGELFIGGVGLAKGYWKDAAKTEARFIRHPETGERLYRTGDLGRYLADGSIEFQGRADFQVKVQGYRIELGEIETVLERHPEVRAAVVTAHGERHGDKRLVAYVVSDGEPTSTHARLRAYLEEKLPRYMVPTLFVALERLPLTANGKVDRKALPAPEEPGTRREHVFEPPADELERTLARIWEEVLGVARVGRHDSFFELGGHSFALVRVMGRIRQQLGRELPLTALVQEPTLAHLASLLREGQGPQTWSPLVPLQTQGKGRPFFCVHPVGGNVLCYRELAQRFGRERPVYGLQARGFLGEQLPHEDLVTMARDYVEAVRAVQPTGPYLLGGWSMGGLVALEMARHLRELGQEVALVALIDSPAPEKLARPDEAERVAWFMRDIAGTAGRPFTLPAEALRPLGAEQRLAFALEKAHEAGVVARDVDLSQLQRLLRVFEADTKAMDQWTPRQVDVPAVLLKAADDTVARADTAAWRPWVKSLEARTLAGDHYSLLSPAGVDTLAAVLRMSLTRAEPR
jgi:amino acid adenylation domain-containing protein